MKVKLNEKVGKCYGRLIIISTGVSEAVSAVASQQEGSWFDAAGHLGSSCEAFACVGSLRALFSG